MLYGIGLLFNYIKITWFNTGILSKGEIVKFTRFRLNHNRLPNHAYLLGFNHSLLCTLHYEPHKFNFTHLIFTYLNLLKQRKELFCENRVSQYSSV